MKKTLLNSRGFNTRARQPFSLVDCCRLVWFAHQKLLFQVMKIPERASAHIKRVKLAQHPANVDHMQVRPLTFNGIP